MLEQIELDWNTIEDISEFKILEKYALEVRLFLIFLSGKCKLNLRATYFRFKFCTYDN